jgi:hypothetical protein
MERNRRLRLDIKYCAGVAGPIYSVDSTTIELAKALFLAFSKYADRWETAISWQVATERPQVRASSLITPSQEVSAAARFAFGAGSFGV